MVPIVFGDCFNALKLLHPLSKPSVSGHRAPSWDIAYKLPLVWLKFRRIVHFDNFSGMAYAHDRTKHDRDLEFLGKFHAEFCKIIGILGCRRIKHGNPCKFCKYAAVLLCLGGVKSGVIRRNQQHTSQIADICCAHQRIACYVEPHLFHRSTGSLSCYRACIGDFKPYFFVRSPLRIDRKAEHFFYLLNPAQYLA